MNQVRLILLACEEQEVDLQVSGISPHSLGVTFPSQENYIFFPLSLSDIKLTSCWNILSWFNKEQETRKVASLRQKQASARENWPIKQSEVSCCATTLFLKTYCFQWRPHSRELLQKNQLVSVFLDDIHIFNIHWRVLSSRIVWRGKFCEKMKLQKRYPGKAWTKPHRELDDNLCLHDNHTSHDFQLHRATSRTVLSLIPTPFEGFSHQPGLGSVILPQSAQHLHGDQLPCIFRDHTKDKESIPPKVIFSELPDKNCLPLDGIHSSQLPLDVTHLGWPVQGLAQPVQ